MWEFSVNIDKKNNQIIDFVNSTSKKFLQDINGFSTLFESNHHVSIIFAVENCHKEKLQSFLLKIITKIITTFYKNDFLTSNLMLKNRNTINFFAFKKALVNFDKETDAFIIAKNLEFEKNLFLESFYEFKLARLREKWNELVALANDNKDYLTNDETLVDLLKFLIDNIDINQSEIDVIEEDGKYRIFSDCEENSLDGLNEESLISSVIDLSPQKINIYCKKQNIATDLLQKIFDKRVDFRFSKNDGETCLSFQKL